MASSSPDDESMNNEADDSSSPILQSRATIMAPNNLASQLQPVADHADTLSSLQQQIATLNDQVRALSQNQPSTTDPQIRRHARSLSRRRRSPSRATNIQNSPRHSQPNRPRHRNVVEVLEVIDVDDNDNVAVARPDTLDSDDSSSEAAAQCSALVPPGVEPIDMIMSLEPDSGIFFGF